MDIIGSLQLFAPELILSFGALFLLLMGAWRPQSRLAPLLAVLLLLGAIYTTIITDAGNGLSGFSGLLAVDDYSLLVKTLVYLAAIIAIFAAIPYFQRVKKVMRAEFLTLILFASVGMALMVSAGDFLTLYIGLELNSLSSYILASFLRDDRRSSEAGLKYFILGSLASGMLLFGISLIYGMAATTNFAEIAMVIQTKLGGDIPIGGQIGIILALSGMAFKISAVPFHMWTPDVYEGAPTPISLFFSTAPKIAAIAMMTRVLMVPLAGQLEIWQLVMTVIALSSIILGAMGAIGQTNIKRLLAYSSINNIGFLLIGLVAGTPAGVAAMLFYLIIYLAMSAAAFLCVLELRDDKGNYIEDIGALAGLSNSRPLLALALAFTMFSLAGIPPLFGFWGKWVVFNAAVNAGLLPLAVIGIVASVVGAFYYIRIVKLLYFDSPVNIIAGPETRISSGQWMLVMLTLFISPLGYLFISTISPLVQDAAFALF